MVRGIIYFVTSLALSYARLRKLGVPDCSWCPDGYPAYNNTLGDHIPLYGECGAPDYAWTPPAYDYGYCDTGLMCAGPATWMQCAVDPTASTVPPPTTTPCAPRNPPKGTDGAPIAPSGYCKYSQIGSAIPQWQDCGHQDYNLATHWEYQSCEGGSTCQGPAEGTVHWTCTAVSTTTTPAPPCNAVAAPKFGLIPLAPEGYCKYKQEGYGFEESQWCGHVDYSNPTQWMWSTCAMSRCQSSNETYDAGKWKCMVDTSTTTPHTTTTLCSGVAVPTDSNGAALAPAGWCVYIEESESVASNQICGHLDYTGAYPNGTWFYGLCTQGYDCHASDLIADQWECFPGTPEPCQAVTPPMKEGIPAAPTGFCSYLKNLGSVADNQMCGHPDWNDATIWDYGYCSQEDSVCAVAPADPTQWDCIPAVAAKHH